MGIRVALFAPLLLAGIVCASRLAHAEGDQTTSRLAQYEVLKSEALRLWDYAQNADLRDRGTTLRKEREIMDMREQLAAFWRELGRHHSSRMEESSSGRRPYPDHSFNKALYIATLALDDVLSVAGFYLSEGDPVYLSAARKYATAWREIEAFAKSQQ